MYVSLCVSAQGGLSLEALTRAERCYREFKCDRWRETDRERNEGVHTKTLNTNKNKMGKGKRTKKSSVAPTSPSIKTFQRNQTKTEKRMKPTALDGASFVCLFAFSFTNLYNKRGGEHSV